MDVHHTRRQFLARSGAAAAPFWPPGSWRRAETAGAAAAQKFKVGAVLRAFGLGRDRRGVGTSRLPVLGRHSQRRRRHRGRRQGMYKASCRGRLQEPADAAADAATRLVEQEKVDALFGSYTSGVQIAMNPIAQKYRTPCIAGSAESPASWCHAAAVRLRHRSARRSHRRQGAQVHLGLGQPEAHGGRGPRRERAVLQGCRAPGSPRAPRKPATGRRILAVPPDSRTSRRSSAASRPRSRTSSQSAATTPS